MMSKSQMHRRAVQAPPVELVWILDRSGSMSSVKAATEEGFDSFIAEQRKVPGECYVSLYQFDDQYETVYEGWPLVNVPKLVLVPRNSTALVDAMGFTLSAALTRIDKDRRVIVGISTDGLENASHVWTWERVAALIDQARARDWQVLFLGANQDAIATGLRLHIPRGSTMNVAGNAQGVQYAYGAFSASTSAYRGGATKTMGFSAADKLRQANVGGVPEAPQSTELPEARPPDAA